MMGFELNFNLPLGMWVIDAPVMQGCFLVLSFDLPFQWFPFRTGSSHVGRIVMTAAAKHLTPVTLELGGKCPAIVDSLPAGSWRREVIHGCTVDVTLLLILTFSFFCPLNGEKVVSKRMIAGKFGTCSGQACIAVDYILVQKELAPTLVWFFFFLLQVNQLRCDVNSTLYFFLGSIESISFPSTFFWAQVELLRGTIKNMLGENPKEVVSRIINKYHFKRLMALLDEPGVRDTIVYGGSTDEDKLYIEPTILLDPPIDSAIMKDEIFGPLLPIITLENIEDSIEFVNSRPKPLTIYCFTTGDKLMQRLAAETSSGALVANDTIVQYLADMIPFGGVGESGFGRYHGKFSFDTFSHEKPVARRPISLDFWFRYPPWNDLKLALFRASYVLKYFEVFLLALGLKKPPPFLSKSS
ncbi:LOW QUALITY PROTEIN: hypothetical protein Cgig2_006411 [Carnegiea gigantea]|uniref:Aldehyde dehydrogenase n=1 Tax=Carnegiea gigantea TaxID=171969 RepID=A0A9Q1JHJ6_9CARY|nr:LOW QUALITY PROTEIN: hypothetical protein Cgig2_006411 [Carnegiea gigantea]